MKKFAFWTTKDGRDIRVTDLADEHLAHIIRGIENKALFPGLQPAGGVADCWLTVMKAEAIQRGLSWDEPPCSKIGLINFLCDTLAKKGWESIEFYRPLLTRELQLLGIAQPELDVSKRTGQPTYLHWRVDVGGTSLNKTE